MGVSDQRPAFTDADARAADALIALALDEDLGPDGDDLTSRLLVPADATGGCDVKSRARGVLAGLPIVERILPAVAERTGNAPLELLPIARDGDALHPGSIVASLFGPVRDLLTAERTILNFLTHLSGVATLTRRFVEAVEGTNAVVLDTRKTHPGYRRLEKYAVRCGGGANHRMGLHDACLVKDNHLAAWRERTGERGDLGALVRRVKGELPAEALLIVEVDRHDQFAAVLPAEPDVILLDNLPPEALKQAVAERDAAGSNVKLEASGGVNLDTVRAIAESGVDRISVGALTHSAVALDLGFDWHDAGPPTLP
ncbi:Nicotinate-nucleotide pyrophosphorylase [carboxylating] [Alienimonas californiensis]|uniref:nicotinate-nucleotide diphosphorylase (carboxylating) n=1 Tax=Alienimonas californiensis TaxID=2527989 RepID=A0A517PE62_9PLAN|nr:Nicotinate-nucleotide pyrophosphorylase [carboxylating] [Alienimonas californiensis]